MKKKQGTKIVKGGENDNNENMQTVSSIFLLFPQKENVPFPPFRWRSSLRRQLRSITEFFSGRNDST